MDSNLLIGWICSYLYDWMKWEISNRLNQTYLNYHGFTKTHLFLHFHWYVINHQKSFHFRSNLFFTNFNSRSLVGSILKVIYKYFLNHILQLSKPEFATIIFWSLVTDQFLIAINWFGLSWIEHEYYQLDWYSPHRKNYLSAELFIYQLNRTTLNCNLSLLGHCFQMLCCLQCCFLISEFCCQYHLFLTSLTLFFN